MAASMSGSSPALTVDAALNRRLAAANPVRYDSGGRHPPGISGVY